MPQIFSALAGGVVDDALGDARRLRAGLRFWACSSRWRAPRGIRVLREVATFYVEIVRGIPMLVLLFYVAFVGAPAIVGCGQLAAGAARSTWAGSAA